MFACCHGEQTDGKLFGGQLQSPTRCADLRDDGDLSYQCGDGLGQMARVPGAQSERTILSPEHQRRCGNQARAEFGERRRFRPAAHNVA